MARLQHIRFNGTANAGGSASWTCPVGVTQIWLWGYGGGGGGGGGRGGATSNTTFSSPGGGGGGAAEAHWIPVTVVPGTTYTITIGAGGAAGASGTGNAGSGGYGGNGGDTIFSDGAGVNVRFIGAKGGRAGFDNFAQGGGTIKPASDENATTGPSQSLDFSGYGIVSPGMGGWGGGSINHGGYLGLPGARGRVQRGTNDGATATRSSTGTTGSDGTGYGGGPGGGGANGPGGVGGFGAGGGNSGGSGGTGVGAGVTGTANNTGGGGGGGGGAGYQGAAGGPGGVGGSGSLTVSYIQ